ncbi:hypothetical protein ACFL3E_01915 [Patescibacteria group bacterium]
MNYSDALEQHICDRKIRRAVLCVIRESNLSLSLSFPFPVVRVPCERIVLSSHNGMPLYSYVILLDLFQLVQMVIECMIKGKSVILYEHVIRYERETGKQISRRDLLRVTRNSAKYKLTATLKSRTR